MSDLSCHHQGVVKMITSKADQHCASCNETKTSLFDSMIEHNNILVVQACPLLPGLQGYQLDPLEVRQIYVNICTYKSK